MAPRKVGKDAVIDEFGVGAPLLGDNIFWGGLVTVPHAHHEIHCGDSYVCSHVIDIPAQSGLLQFYVVVPNHLPAYPDQDQKLYHVEPIVLAEAEAQFTFYESPIVSANGTSLPQINRNRNSDLTSELLVYHTPTVTAPGTLLETYHIGGSGAVKGGGSARPDEFVLRNDTTYLYRIQNLFNGANHATLVLNYYIHPGI